MKTAEILEEIKKRISAEAKVIRKEQECSVFEAYDRAKVSVMQMYIHSLYDETLADQVELLKALVLLLISDDRPRG